MILIKQFHRILPSQDFFPSFAVRPFILEKFRKLLLWFQFCFSCLLLIYSSEKYYYYFALCFIVLHAFSTTHMESACSV